MKGRIVLSLGIKEYDEVKTVLIMMTSDVEIIVMLDRILINLQKGIRFRILFVYSVCVSKSPKYKYAHMPRYKKLFTVKTNF